LVYGARWRRGWKKMKMKMERKSRIRRDYLQFDVLSSCDVASLELSQDRRVNGQENVMDSRLPIMKERTFAACKMTMLVRFVVRFCWGYRLVKTFELFLSLL
jgi:hypothetical protein